MTNEEKVKELLGAPTQWTFNYWLEAFSEATQKELREKRNLLIQMAEWKDQQFKEYLEKKSRNAETVWNVSHHEDYTGGFMDAIHEIIEVLFGEDATDQSDNDE